MLIEIENSFNRAYKHPLLFNMEFVVVGNLEKSTVEIKDMIRKLGGKVVSKIDANLAAVISSKEEVQSMGSQMEEAKRFNIQVVSVEFLNISQFDDPILYIISENLAEWGGDVSEFVWLACYNLLLLMIEI